MKRKQLTADPDQMYITDYYEVIDMLEKLQNENESLKSSINQMKTQFESIRKQYSGGFLF